VLPPSGPPAAARFPHAVLALRAAGSGGRARKAAWSDGESARCRPGAVLGGETDCAEMRTPSVARPPLLGRTHRAARSGSGTVTAVLRLGASRCLRQSGAWRARHRRRESWFIALEQSALISAGCFGIGLGSCATLRCNLNGCSGRRCAAGSLASASGGKWC